MASHKTDLEHDSGHGTADRRVVVLRHDSGAEHHFDWMFEIGTGEDDRLKTWRCVLRPDLAGAGDVFRAERLDDHRRTYLEFEGEISGGRGSVNRIAQGTYRDQFNEKECGSKARSRVIRWSSGITQRWIFEADRIRCTFSRGDSQD